MTASVLHWHHSLLPVYVTLYSVPSSSSLLLTVNISNVCFWFKFKRLQRILKSYLIFTEVTFIGGIFLFLVFSVFLSFVSFFLVAANKKNSIKLRID